MNVNLQIKTFTLNANEVRSLNMNGSFLLISSNTGSFNFSIDGGPYNPGLSILGIDVSRDPNVLGSVTKPVVTAPQFKELIFQDTSGGSNTITIAVANFPVTYATPTPTVSTKLSPTVNVGVGPKTIANAATDNYNGTARGTLRKQIIFTNLDATHALQILDGSGNLMSTLAAGTTWTVESSDKFQIHNASGASVAYNVGEVYYAS